MAWVNGNKHDVGAAAGFGGGGRGTGAGVKRAWEGLTSLTLRKNELAQHLF